MGKFLVMDVVFYGSSLNYDQGSGNYQELKKITRWDGRQYTLVSRYALRYSLLETGKKLGLWEVAEGEKFHWAGGGDNTVIQPATDLLLTGEILLYPEFDLFGYLITSTTPQNFRSAPAKLSHAISMTPFNYDALFNANLGMANRMRKIHGEMKPNPFTAEEHETFYLYPLVVDVDEVGKLDVFVTLGSDITLGRDEKGKEIKAKIENVVEEDNKVKFILNVNKSRKELVQSENVKLETFEKINNKLVHIRYSLTPEEIQERINKLVSGILALKRSIKGRDEDLRPKLLVLGLYKDTPYQTFKDRIQLVDEYTEEEYDEIEEHEEDGKKIVKVKHRVSKSRKPVFEISGLSGASISPIGDSEILNAINTLFNADSELSEVRVFHDSNIEVLLK